MTFQLSPYITFNGNCRDAMTFYQSCLGGDLHLQEVAGSAVENQVPPEYKNSILHSALTTKDAVILASDMCREGKAAGNNIGLCLNCQSEEQVKTLFSKLVAGGESIQEPKREFWGAVYGELRDTFGIRWLLNFQEQPMK